MTQRGRRSGRDESTVRELLTQGKLALRLLGDRRVPLAIKLIPALAVGYLLWPLDPVPDIMPGLGQIDDLVVLLIALKVFIEMAPSDVVSELKGDGDTTTVTTTYRMADDGDRPGDVAGRQGSGRAGASEGELSDPPGGDRDELIVLE